MAEPTYRVLEILAQLLVLATGTRITYVGEENVPDQGGAVVAINHTSYVDWLPAALAMHRRRRRMRFMIKAEMQRVRLVNFLIRHTRTIPVDRGAGGSAYAVAVQRLREGELVGVYPEATISRSFELKGFKTGAARMAAEADVPIVPVVVWGAQRIWTKDHPRQIGRAKVPVTVQVGRPLRAAAGIEQTNAALRESMTALLWQAQERYPHPAGAYWVPRRLGGGAPTLAEAARMEADEAAARAASRTPHESEILVPSIVAANGNKITFEGLENIPERGGALIALNHTSYVDWVPASIAAHHRRRRLRFMIKAEMQDVRAVNYVIKHAQLIPVDRSVGADAYAVAVQRLRAGELVGLHPEATISRSLELREFKTGAARMALEAQVPIIPMIVWGAHRIWPKDHPKNLFRNKIPIVAAIGSPVRPEGNAEQLNAVLRQAMNAILYRVQEEYPHPKGEHWVPRRLGGGAPTVEESRQLRIAELAKRRQKRGYDGVTSSRRSQVGPH